MEQIERLRKQIKENHAYARLNRTRQKEAIDGKWRFGNSWLQLATIAGGSQRYFKGLYAYLSSYAHAGYLSALQIGQTKNYQGQLQFGEMHIRVGLTIMSYFLTDYASLFPPVAAAIDANPEAKRLIEMWHIPGTDIESMYEDSP
jgi:hypothetical protein